MSELVSSETIASGETGQIKVTLDPTGKFGHVVKTVTIKSNNLTQPVIDIPLYATVLHGVDADSSEPIEDVLFGRPECAECHADPGEGLVGAPLYAAVCAMCHGTMGGYVESLPADAREQEALRAWIAEGRGETGMPGYSASKGGPLTDEQIESLVTAMAGGG